MYTEYTEIEIVRGIHTKSQRKKIVKMDYNKIHIYVTLWSKGSDQENNKGEQTASRMFEKNTIFSEIRHLVFYNILKHI